MSIGVETILGNGLARAASLVSLPGSDQQQFRDMLDALPAAIYTTDAQGRITHFNPACIAFSGRTPELGSDSWCVTWKLYYPDGRPMRHDECPMAIALKTGQPVRGAEAIAERPDGSRIWFTPYPTPLFDDAGNIVGGINMLVDITERKVAEEEHRRNDERYHRLIEMLPVAVYACEAPTGKISYFNEQAARLWGRTPDLGDTDERFCGSHSMFLPDGTPLPHDQCPMAVALREGQSFRNADVIVQRPDGSRIHASVNIDPIKDSCGRVVGAINAFRDITAIKQADQKLRESEERFRTLTEAITSIVWTTDPEGRFIEHQRPWGRYTGQTWEQMRDFGWAQAIHPEDRESVRELWQRALDSKTLYKSDGRLWHAPSNSYRHFEARGAPILNADGSIREWVGKCLDVHERKKAERALREHKENLEQMVAERTERLRTADRMAAVGTLASGLAHDMQNVLLPLSVRLDMLLTHASVDGATHDHLTAVQGLMAHLREMARNLSLFARDPEQEGIIGETDLADWCSRAWRFIEASVRGQPGSGAASIELVCEISNESPIPVIPIAPHRLTQVVQNLVHNARDAVLARRSAPGAGAQGTYRGTIALRASAQNDLVTVTVSDDGIGMDEETRRRCIEPFFTTKDRPHTSGGASLPAACGSGIGLALANSIIERCGGTMDIGSSQQPPHQGTTVTMRFPAVAPHPRAAVNAR